MDANVLRRTAYDYQYRPDDRRFAPNPAPVPPYRFRRPVGSSNTERPWQRSAAKYGAVASVTIAVALWASHGGFQQLISGDKTLVAVAHLLGLVAADLLLVQVLLMARIPWVERAYGQDELARVHRFVGQTSFTLLIAHVLLALHNRAAAAGQGYLSGSWNVICDAPGMLLATVGTILLIMVVATSMRAARRKLRYESFHLIHLYAYIGVGLSIPHEIWAGHDFTMSPWAQIYWWSIYAAAAGSVLMFRVVTPLHRTIAHRLTVDRVVTEAPGVVSLYMSGHRLARMRVAAGQFFIWRFLDGPGSTRGNPFSLSAAPNRNHLRITVKSLGDGSSGLAWVRPGCRVVIEGPYGRLTGAVRKQRKLTMIASGIGITPIRALLEELDYAPGEAVLIYRASTEQDVVFREELDALAAHRGIRIVYLIGRRAQRWSSWLPDEYSYIVDEAALLQLVPDIEEHDVFVCGPNPWMDTVESAIVGAGVPREQIHLERFGW